MSARQVLAQVAWSACIAGLISAMVYPLTTPQVRCPRVPACASVHERQPAVVFGRPPAHAGPLRSLVTAEKI